MPDGKLPDSIILRDGTKVRPMWQFYASGFDDMGNPCDYYIPILPWGMTGRSYYGDVLSNIYTIDKINGEVLWVDPQTLGGRNLNLDLLQQASSYASVANRLLVAGLPQAYLANPEVEQFIMDSGIALTEGNEAQLETFAKYLISTGGRLTPQPEPEKPLLTPYGEIPAPPAGGQPVPIAGGVRRILTMAEIKEQGIRPGPQDVVLAASAEEARSVGGYYWASGEQPAESGMVVKAGILPEQRLMGRVQAQYTGLGPTQEERAEAAQTKQKQKRQEDVDWERLVRQARTRPQRVVRL